MVVLVMMRDEREDQCVDRRLTSSRNQERGWKPKTISNAQSRGGDDEGRKQAKGCRAVGGELRQA